MAGSGAVAGWPGEAGWLGVAGSAAAEGVVGPLLPLPAPRPVLLRPLWALAAAEGGLFGSALGPGRADDGGWGFAGRAREGLPAGAERALPRLLPADSGTEAVSD